MDLLPSEYERQIARKRIPGLLSAIATAENRAELWGEDKAKQEDQRAQRLRAVVARLLVMTAGTEEMGSAPLAAPAVHRRSGGGPPTPIARSSSGVIAVPPTAAPPAAAPIAQTRPPESSRTSMLVPSEGLAQMTPLPPTAGDERSPIAPAPHSNTAPAPEELAADIASLSACVSAILSPSENPVAAPISKGEGVQSKGVSPTTPMPMERPMNTPEVAPGVRTRRRGDST